jgi:hypothetical protein
MFPVISLFLECFVLFGQLRYNKSYEGVINMIKKNSFLLFILAISTIYSTALLFPGDCTKLESLNWLLGGWESASGKNVVIESWQKISPQTFEGKGQTASKATNKVALKESLRLVEMSGEVFYLAKVGHNPYPVPFKLVECGKDFAFFENTTHDFPNRIEYRLINKNELVVSVKNNKGKGFKINFKKK